MKLLHRTKSLLADSPRRAFLQLNECVSRGAFYLLGYNFPINNPQGEYNEIEKKIGKH